MDDREIERMVLEERKHEAIQKKAEEKYIGRAKKIQYLYSRDKILRPRGWFKKRCPKCDGTLYGRGESVIGMEKAEILKCLCGYELAKYKKYETLRHELYGM